MPSHPVAQMVLLLLYYSHRFYFLLYQFLKFEINHYLKITKLQN